MFEMAFGLKLPDAQQVPPIISIDIACNKYSEQEARFLMVDNGEPQDTIERRIQCLKEHGFFGNSSSNNIHSESDEDNDVAPIEDAMKNEPSQAEQEATVDHRGGVDASAWLWEKLKAELEKNENSVKHRFAAFDTFIKQDFHNGYSSANMSNQQAEEDMPFARHVVHNFPWSGCKFVAAVLLHLVSQPDVASKRKAIRSTSHMLGGITLPSRYELEYCRQPYQLSQKFADAKAEAEFSDQCTALYIQVIDVEVMRNPSNSGKRRPGTFAHSCIMTVAPSGVYLYQGYGPVGYTLLQHMQKQEDSSPMSWKDGDLWISHFATFVSHKSGEWTQTVNDAYHFCFGVDLIQLGNMRLGSQLDVYHQVAVHPFDAKLVRANWALLPLPLSNASSYPTCNDGKFTSKKKAKSLPNYHRPDGGVKQYYVPSDFSCRNRLCRSSSAVDTNHLDSKRPIAFREMNYCSHECQEAMAAQELYKSSIQANEQMGANTTKEPKRTYNRKKSADRKKPSKGKKKGGRRK